LCDVADIQGVDHEATQFDFESEDCLLEVEFDAPTSTPLAIPEAQDYFTTNAMGANTVLPTSLGSNEEMGVETQVDEDNADSLDTKDGSDSESEEEEDDGDDEYDFDDEEDDDDD
jgi:hypothetical protein